VGFVEGLTPLISGTLNTFSHRKVISTRKVIKGIALILINQEATNLILTPNARANNMLGYDCGEGFYWKER